MTEHDIDRVLTRWFEADAHAAVPTDDVDRVLAVARRRAPRPAWVAHPGSHWGWSEPRDGSLAGARDVPGSTIRWTTAIALSVLLGALAAGAAVLGARLLESPAPLTRLPGHLAYAVGGDIFVADWDGGNPVKIADGLPGGKLGCGSAGYWAEGGMWSPDGRYLAFRSPRRQVDCSSPEADTFPTVQVTDSKGDVIASVPGVGWQIPWSPDSTRFATWLDFYPGTKIGVYGIDGVRQAVISLPAAVAKEFAGDYDPVWSTDGTSLLLRVNGEIWDLPVDGRAARLVPADDPRSQAPIALSPNGSRIAYVDGNGLIVAASDGSGARTLTYHLEGGWWDRLVWSPMGDRIAFDAPDLRIIDVASGSVTRLVANDTGAVISVIAFSPDGDRILFSKDGGGTAPSLWTVRIDGSDVRRLVSGTVVGDWQPAAP